MSGSLTFDAVSEDRPGAKWLRRWNWSWPAYEAWFKSRGGDQGPSRAECEAAIRRYMPEMVNIQTELSELAGGGDRAARFLSGWCPPAYLGGCSLAAHASDEEVRLVRNYDLSADLNEGFLLRSDWRQPVMGMVEFLCGLSDGINQAGLCVALAYGGRGTTRRGFGITHIVRYLLETCDTVDAALKALARVPSHVAYNLVLADASGQVASVELLPGGGLRQMEDAIATNHQHGPELPDRPEFTRTVERRTYMASLIHDGIAPEDLGDRFLGEPLYQSGHAEGFGTLFTADYDPPRGGLRLLWHGEVWEQSLSDFGEGSRTIRYESGNGNMRVCQGEGAAWSGGTQDAASWVAFGMSFVRRYTQADFGQTIHAGWHG